MLSALPPFSAPILPNTFLISSPQPSLSSGNLYNHLIFLSCTHSQAFLFHRVCVYGHSKYALVLTMYAHMSPCLHRCVHEILSRAYFKYSDPPRVEDTVPSKKTHANTGVTLAQWVKTEAVLSVWMNWSEKKISCITFNIWIFIVHFKQRECHLVLWTNICVAIKVLQAF